MTHLVEGKAGLVTGAGSGIGRAGALALASSGAKVMVSDIDEAAGGETVELIRDAGGTAEFFRCNVAEETQVAALVDAAVSTFGKLDFAFNNAGMNGVFAPLDEIDSATWDRVISVNLTSVFYCLKYELAAMKKQGGGSIVNTSSGAGLTGIFNNGPYNASKFGVVGLTRNAAMDYGQFGIRVNALAPGSTATPMMMNAFEQNTEEFKAQILNSIPMRSLVEPADQGAAVVWLCSDTSKMVSGIALPVDGGWLAGK
ncbi:SDR family NAD(P)-dependent oxidoreductase [Pseudoclavibacter sp. VKM Ac-2867]|uniref:SDR family NAD(P)-dependent oxidoreductase n=1 Tax=Pseudoclavibacter sp. VKM Ac-2867 TaxID=2783829 RepID=UPI00188D739D|nr:glucose 1-dehydrogenase [Pseudoclavibacter sp. VKM Ac-2867]MBF4460286.1 glucose 1-dehydrogenase [Pseudoclavibacter sp. VKM Ac-2867]